MIRFDLTSLGLAGGHIKTALPFISLLTDKNGNGSESPGGVRLLTRLLEAAVIAILTAALTMWTTIGRFDERIKTVVAQADKNERRLQLIQDNNCKVARDVLEDILQGRLTVTHFRQDYLPLPKR